MSKANMAELPRLRTGIYIDGYNLYYGALRDTPFKWLDVVELFRRITRTVEPSSEVMTVRYFTAPALTRFSGHGEASMKAQNDYHRALEAKYTNLFVNVLGSHVFEKSGTSLPVYVPGQPFDRSNTVKVWRLVEKKTDVNLAMAMYRDVCKQVVDHVVLISNDTDAEPVLAAIREDFPSVRIGVIMPIREGPAGKKRPASTTLSSLADWTRHYIRKDELAAAQLPPMVPTRKKPAVKPSHW